MDMRKGGLWVNLCLTVYGKINGLYYGKQKHQQQNNTGRMNHILL